MMKKNRVIIFSTILILVFSATLTSAIKVEKTSHKLIEKEEANWTVMYYLCGDIDGYDSWLLPILENLTKIKSDEKLNLIVLYDGYGDSNTNIYYIDESGEKIVINDDYHFPAEVDTSSPNTLELFCTQTIIDYPAESYCLIPVMSGGTGWQLICFHDSEGKTGMTMPVFRQALANIYENTQTKIDVLYTSCAMNMVEVAYEIKDYVDYIVGTQDCLAKKHLVGRFYEPLLDLKNDSSMSPEEFANKAPERLIPLEFYYNDQYSEKGILLINKILNKLPFEKLHCVKYYDSTAVINNSNIDLLKKSIDDLSKYLILNINDCTLKNDIKKSLDETKKYGKCMAKFRLLSIIHLKYQFEFLAFNSNIDLHQFAENLKKNTDNNYIKTLCQNVMDKNNLSITSIKKIVNESCNGISIYFPPSNFYYNKHSIKPSKSCPYEDLKFSEESSWDEFIKIYLGID